MAAAAVVVLFAAGGAHTPIRLTPGGDVGAGGTAWARHTTEPTSGDEFSDALVAGRLTEPGPPGTSPPTAPPGADPLPEAPPPTAGARERPIVPPPAFRRRPARPARAPRALTAAPGPKEGGVWAVVVGIDDYPGEEADLRAAKADARDVDAALAAYGVPPDRRILLLDHDASAANIRGSLSWLAAHASADATAVFFYSGHVRQISGDPDGDGEGVDEAIVAADGHHVVDGEVADLLRGLEARSVWLGIAACYGSGFDDAVSAGRLLTAAAAEPDLAYENTALGHSYLVEYMVRRAMLQAQAPGSVQEAFTWARGQIARDYPNRQPVIVDRSRGPVVLGVRAAPPAPPREEPRPQPAPAQPEPQPQKPAPPAEPEPSSPGEGQPGACAQVLGVSVCSEGRASLAVGAAWRPEP